MGITTGYPAAGSLPLAQMLPLEAGACAAAGMDPRQLEPISAFTEPIFRDGALSAKVKLLALFLVATVRGNEAEAERAMRASLRAGLTRPELVDGLLAGVLSRGITVLWRGIPWLADAPAGDGAAVEAPAGADRTAEERLAYFARVYGELPQWVADLADSAPDFFRAYHDLRAEVLADGPLPRREKELLLVSINAVERYEFGLLHHLRGAFAGGGTWDQAVEAILVGVAAGGMPAWLEAAPVLRRVAGEFEEER